MTNSRSIQRLEDDSRKRWPGMTIWDTGDEAHSRSTSGHNHDDKWLPGGGRAEQQDSDTKQEVRALDHMRGPKFSAVDAKFLFEALTRRPANQKRLLYVIYNRRIRRAANGWKDEAYHGDNPHTDHVHTSGLAKDDENTAPWDIGPAPIKEDDEMTPAQAQQLEVDAWRLDALTYGKDVVSSGPRKGEKVWIVTAVKAIQAELTNARKAADAAAGRSRGLLLLEDVTSSWSTKDPNGIDTNKLADAIDFIRNAATQEQLRTGELKALYESVQNGSKSAEEALESLGELLEQVDADNQ